jgi:hypothetical protein
MVGTTCRPPGLKFPSMIDNVAKTELSHSRRCFTGSNLGLNDVTVLAGDDMLIIAR